MSFATASLVKHGSFLERAGFVPSPPAGNGCAAEDEDGRYKAVEQTLRDGDRVPMLGVRLRGGAEFAVPYLMLSGVFCNQERGTLTVRVADGRLHFHGRNLGKVFDRIFSHRAVFVVEAPFQHNQIGPEAECIERIDVELDAETRSWLGIA